MPKVILLTSDQLRHDFFRIKLSNTKNIKVLKSFSEKKQSLGFKYDIKKIKKNLDTQHIFKREIVERDFFSDQIKILKDNSKNIYCPKGFSSTDKCFKIINKLNPDLIIVYGTSIIKGKILKKYKGKIINFHLGLSPYYRGAATNFFAFNDNNLQCVGSTFMYIDKGIDTGEIIHQVRAKMYYGDTFHQICTRLIVDSIEALKILIVKFKKIKRKKSKKSALKKYYYKRSDFQKVSLRSFYKKFDQNLSNYLSKKNKINRKNKIIKQTFIK